MDFPGDIKPCDCSISISPSRSLCRKVVLKSSWRSSMSLVVTTPGRKQRVVILTTREQTKWKSTMYSCWNLFAMILALNFKLLEPKVCSIQKTHRYGSARWFSIATKSQVLFSRIEILLNSITSYEFAASLAFIASLYVIDLLEFVSLFVLRLKSPAFSLVMPELLVVIPYLCSLRLRFVRCSAPRRFYLGGSGHRYLRNYWP